MCEDPLGGILDNIGCDCGSCSLESEAVSKKRSILVRVPVLLRLSVSVLFFALGFLCHYGFLISYFFAGIRVVYTSIKRINLLDEFFLMTIASLGAMAIGEYPEAAAVMILFEIGEYFKDKAVDKSKLAISDLLDLRPKEVYIRKNGTDIAILPEKVEIGDILTVKVGERIAMEGILLSENAVVNNAAISGESVPVSVSCGQEVISGGVVIGHPIEIRVNRKFHDSTISKIIALVQEAKEKKTPTEQFISRFAKIYTPLVVLSAILLIFLPPLLFGWNTFNEWLHRGLIFLVVSCPCALVISVPLSYFAGIGKASSQGMLFKGSAYLDAISHADHIVFDKTGTLTTGEFTVESSDLTDNGALLRLLIDMERGSIHPLALAVTHYAEAALGKLHTADSDHSSRIASIAELPGKGLKATLQNGETALLGSRQLMTEYGISAPSEDSDMTTLHLAVRGEYAGKLELSDQVRDDSLAAIRELKKQMKTTLLSGDRKEIAEKIGASLKIDESHGEMLPENKYNYVQELVNKGKTVIFVGDGINDAPVLAGANIGISMGLSGSDAAIEASDAVLMKPGIGAIPTIIRISKHTKRIVTQNIILSLGIKAAVLTLSAIGIANMWMAVLADVGAALLAVLNTIRITTANYKTVR